ncbi:hypothetical protein BRD19_10630 [Halobacteriales archaeon SW_7_65_23]|nr:MAG: hypothetical protein BRD19_10630 [Halobacteriales archaeon SW_7_65_23]
MVSEILTDRLRETLTLFDEGGEPLTTTEVADLVDVGRRSTYERLETLVEHNRLRTKKVGANARVWWRPATQLTAKTPDWSAAADSLVGDVLDDVAVSIFVLDENFDVAWINEATERYFGLDRDGVLGRDKRTLVEKRIAPTIEDSDAFVDTVLATYDDNTDTERFECHVLSDNDREARWLEHRSKPIEAGAYAGGRVELYYDITDRKRSERTRREDRQEFASLVNAVDEYAIFTLDADGHVRTWNPGAERIKGYEADDILGEHFSQFYTEEDRTANVPQQNLAAAAEHGSIQDEGWRVRQDGSRFWADVTITAIREDNGDLQGYAKVTRDMTDQRRAKVERELLYETTRSIAEADTFDAGLRAALQDVCERTDWEYAEAWLPTDEGDLRRAEADYHVDGLAEFAAFSAEFTFGPGEGLPGRVYNSGEFEWATDLPSESRKEYPRLDKALDAELQSSLGVPVVAQGEVVAVLTFIMRDSQERDERFVSLVTSVAEELGDLIAQKRTEEQLEREQELVERIFETAPIGLSVFGPDREIERGNEWLTDVLGPATEDPTAYAADDLTLLDEEGQPLAFEDRPVGHVFETGEPVVNQELQVLRPDGSTLWVSVNATPIDDETGDVTRIIVTTTDITQFRGQARRLERRRDELETELEESRNRYQTLIENFPNGAVALVDEDFQYSTFGGTPGGDTGVTRDDLEGQPVREALPERIAEVVVPRYDAALEGEPSEFVETIDGRDYQFHFVPVRDDDGDVFAAAAMSQDITERREREQQLRARVRQQEVVTELGQRALEDRDLDTLMAEAAEFIADTLDNDYCKVLDLDGEAEKLLLRQGVGWHDGIVGEATVSATENDSQAAYTLATEEPVVVEDLASESRFSGPDLLRDHDVRSGISTIIGPRDDPWGILGTHDTETKESSEHDAAFVQAVANILASAIEQHNYEQELIQQREQIAALNSLNEVARDITAAVIDQSTRKEIEQTVCERLAGTDSYLFAWTGEVDPASQTVTLRTEAGVDGYLDGITVSVNPDDARSEGPTGRALRTGETQVTHDIRTDSRHDPWRDHIEQYGFRSSAAIPITHEDTIYGVLNVYADRPYAFGGQERAVIDELGAVVGHAIAAAERKQALLSDELVELDFHIQDVFAAVDASVETSGTFTLDQIVSVDDGEFLIYGTATEDAVDTMHGLVEALPDWKSVSIVSDDEPVRLELRVIDPPVLSVVASHGGYIDEAILEDGDCRMTIHLAPTVDVRTITDAVEAAYPQTELLRRQQISQPHDEPLRLQTHLAAELTERQRSALEAAYHAGFFKWPRETNGEQIAESYYCQPRLPVQ